MFIVYLSFIAFQLSHYVTLCNILLYQFISARLRRSISLFCLAIVSTQLVRLIDLPSYEQE